MTNHPQSRQRLWVRLFLVAVFLTPIVSLLFFAAIGFLGHDLRP